MQKLYKNPFPADKVRLCNRNTCIEARGDNGRLLVFAVSLVLFSMALYYLSKISISALRN